MLTGLVLWLLALPLLFFLFMPLASWVASLAWPRPKTQPTIPEADYALVFCAYKDASITQAGIEALLAGTPAAMAWHIYVIADDATALPQIEHARVSIIKPTTALHSKVKSERLALQSYVRPHSHAVILDADNVPRPGFLQEMDKLVRAGYPIVQGCRTALNEDTQIARLDSLNELYYNYSVRHMPFHIGSSATLSGSAFAITTALLAEWLDWIKAREAQGVIVAEDKLLQIYAGLHNQRVAYTARAVVFDAKIREGQQLERQRTRWLNAWIRSLPAGYGLLGRGLQRLNWNQTYYGLLQVYPPMFMLLGASILLTLIAAPFQWHVSLALGIGLAAFVINFFLVLKLAQAPASVYRGLWNVPQFVWRQCRALLQFKKADKSFMHTTHTPTVTR